MPDLRRCRRPPEPILVVEDDALTRFLYKSYLAPHAEEFSCRFEVRGEAALARLDIDGAAVVVLDWDLPGMSGLEVLRRMRASPSMRTVPVLFVTGRASPDDKAAALACGAGEYLSKPVSRARLVRGLRVLARRRRVGIKIDP